MRIAIAGGGPGGLYLAVLLAQLGRHDVTVWERNSPDDTFGFGVVLSDETLGGIEQADPVVFAAMTQQMARWDDIDVHHRGAVSTSGGHGFAAIGRRELLRVLQHRCAQLGITVHYRTRCPDAAVLQAEHDLVVAADGVNSALRSRGSFGTRLVRRRNMFLWLGTDLEFASFTFPFVSTPAGWVWGHAYGYADGASTFVVETTPETWSGLGFDDLGPDATIRRLEELFADSLQGHRLQLRASAFRGHPWTAFVEVHNERWIDGNVALLGVAAHTTHFTIGSGTRLAMEDALALADALADEPDLTGALQVYDRTRREHLHGVQRVARRSARWFERVPRYITRPAPQFATLMENRRSPVMAHLPVGAYLRLTGTAASLPVIEAPLRRLLARL